MSDYFGDIRLGDTIDIKFTTRQISGAPFTLAGSPVISAYPSNSTTELTAGITLSVDFDSRTGYNNVRVVATSGNGYATATNYDLCITTGTVNSVSVVGESIGSFSIENRSALMPTTAARTLAVDASGRSLSDVDTIKTNPVVNGGTITFPTTATLASTTNITAATGIDVTKWLGGTIPAVNVTGVPLVDLKYTLGTISPATAGSVRADAVTGAVGSVTGAVGSVTGNVGGNVVGSVASVTGNVGGNVVGSVGSIASGGIVTASFGAGSIVTGSFFAGAITSAVVNASERNAAADALLARNVSGGSSTGRLVSEALYPLRNKFTVSSDGTYTVFMPDDTTIAWTSSLSTNASAIPIVGSDPA